MSTSARGRAARRPKDPARSTSRCSATFVLFVGDVHGRRACATRRSASAQVILNIFVDNAFLLVVAVGMTFVILTGGIDLSVGAVVALATHALRRR